MLILHCTRTYIQYRGPRNGGWREVSDYLWSLAVPVTLFALTACLDWTLCCGSGHCVVQLFSAGASHAACLWENVEQQRAQHPRHTPAGTYRCRFFDQPHITPHTLLSSLCLISLCHFFA